MAGLELVVGYLAAWLWRKSRRVVAAVDQDVDAALDVAVGRLHEAVAARLGGDAAWQLMEREASAGSAPETAVSTRTRQRVQLALEEAVDQNADFARLLEGLAAQVREAGGERLVANLIGTGLAAQNIQVSAPGGMAAALNQGTMTQTNPPPPGSKLP